MTAKWSETDEASPFLITEVIKNRSTLVYKKIKILMKQPDEAVPSGPTYWGQEDTDDTIDNFLKEQTDGSRLASVADSQNPAKSRLKIDEKWVHHNLDQMCGKPREAILYFNR